MIYYNIKLNIVLPGITSYFDPGFDVQASGEQLFNFVLTVSIGLFALSVIIPVRILIINNVDDYIYSFILCQDIYICLFSILDYRQDSWVEITTFADNSRGEDNQ